MIREEKRKGNLASSEANVANKHSYLRNFFANRAKPPGEQPPVEGGVHR
jgi:hypothetical protein